MKLKEWTEEATKWDDYKKRHMRFYGEWHTPLFTQFDDGSMMLRQGGVKPGYRAYYKDIGIQIVAGRDSDCPKLMLPDGRKVPKAWVQSELLVVDHDTRVVVTKRSAKNSYAGELPDYAKRASVYWPFPGARPWGGKVLLTLPKKLTKDEKDHVTALRAACKVWYEFSGKDAKYDRHWWNEGACTSDEMLKINFSDASPDARRRIAMCRYETSPEKKVVDYLLLAEA
tara:strand:+ start:655 stop:1335 length:681 start_codon:yes stop_codon:yes gene_type:complete